MHPPKSKLGYLAWELIEGAPNPITIEEMEKQHKSNGYEEPSEEYLFNQIHRIPLESGMTQHLQPFILQMSLEQYWNAFYDNEAPFFINKMTEEQGNELLN